MLNTSAAPNNLKQKSLQLNKLRIRDLIIVIENLYNPHNVNENKIISDISILERLLIKKEANYDIGKQFGLKVGLLLRENYKGFTDKDVKKVNYCYAVRSHLLHGNDEEIYSLPRKYLKISNEEWNELFKDLHTKNKRQKILFLANMYLRDYMKTLLQQWVVNTDKIEFMKNN